MEPEKSGSQLVSSLPLSDEQRQIVELPVEARTLVTAGPGTGKTHVLVARLSHLIEQQGLLPGADVLVLSFSRAAVREIRTRLAKADSDARYVAAHTFDSFATRLLAGADPDGNWIHQDFDGRIRAATLGLNVGGRASEDLASYRHVMIDEIQDLVTDRANFVKAVLESTGGGFTLYGDPAQGIYTWQVEDKLRVVGAGEFFDWLAKRYPGLSKKTLTTNYRAGNRKAQVALWAGAELNSVHPDYRVIDERLKSQLAGVEAGTLEQYAERLRKPRGATAILCRNNGQALVVSRELHKLQVAHRLQRLATDRVLPAWIARVLGDSQSRSVRRTEFLEKVSARHNSEDPSAEDAWRLLKRAIGGPPSNMDLSELAQCIRSGRVPDELVELPRAMVTISTIHRAKGLEFERVLLIENDRERENADELQFAEEVRVRYVAMTRAKKELLCLMPPEFGGVYQLKRSGRWIRGYHDWQVLDLEMIGDDVHAEEPAGAFLATGENALNVQKYIAAHIKVGDDLKLLRYSIASDPDACAYYAIQHGNQLVGMTSRQFGRTLYVTLRDKPYGSVKWPLAIQDVVVEGIDTVAGTDAAGERAGLGLGGLWLRVRTGGFGRLQYE